MKIVMIRHGQTPGNKEKRYIGTTDESLSEEGIGLVNSRVEKGLYPNVEEVYISPLKRCVETAELIYPEQKKRILSELRECDFGEFENKNHIELAGNENYQRWIDSGGMLAFPQGEEIEAFQKRCVSAFLETIWQSEADSLAFVVHGGTIMSILFALNNSRASYFDWMVGNAGGYLCEYDKETKELQVLEELDV